MIHSNAFKKPYNLALQANDLGSNPARYGLFLTVHVLSCTAEKLPISISQQLIMTQTMLTGAQKIEGCGAHA